MVPSLDDINERVLQGVSCKNATFICSSDDDCCVGLSCETIGSRNQINVCVGESFDEVGAPDGLTFGLIFMCSFILLSVFWCGLRIFEAQEEEEDTDYASKKGTRYENPSLLSSRPPANKQLQPKMNAETESTVQPEPMANPKQQNLRYRSAKSQPSKLPSIDVGGGGK